MTKRHTSWALFIFPLLLFTGLLMLFVRFGPLGIFQAGFPPVEKVFISRVIFQPEQITLRIFNDGPEDVTVAQAIINDVYWRFTTDPESRVLAPHESGELRFYYPWIHAEPMTFKLIASDGVVFEKHVPVAFLTPVADARYVRTFILLGLYVGVIPVLLGLLWLPYLKRITDTAHDFLLAATVGLLVFLGFDALEEAFSLIAEIPQTYNGLGLLMLGGFGTILLLGAIRHRTDKPGRQAHEQVLHWSYLIAIGIGLHNLGEGLAIGSSYAIGEIALGGSLVIGFMLHNLTEGIAIVAPLSRSLNIARLGRHVVQLGLIAGIPTILGSLLGGFAYSPAVAIVFLAIGVGAIFDVVLAIVGHMGRSNGRTLYSPANVSGFFAGLCVMYATGFFVA